MSKSARVRIALVFEETDELGRVTERRSEKYGAYVTTDWGGVEQVAQKACDLVYARVTGSLPEFLEGIRR